MGLGDCPGYMLGMMLINVLEKGKLITVEEEQRFIDVIEGDNWKAKEEEVVFRVWRRNLQNAK